MSGERDLKLKTHILLLPYKDKEKKEDTIHGWTNGQSEL